MTDGTQSDVIPTVVELTDPIEAWSVVPYGQSHRPGSRHCAGPAHLHSVGRMRPAWHAWSQLRDHVESVEVFEYRPGMLSPKSATPEGLIGHWPLRGDPRDGQACLVYSLNGGSGTVTLAAGAYRAARLDSRTGATADLGTVGGGSVGFSLPPGDDWVLLFRRRS